MNYFARFSSLLSFTLTILVSIGFANASAVFAQDEFLDGFQNVSIGGMGFVTGVINHPNEAGLTYVRTDVGGVYRQDEANGIWKPLNDSFTPLNSPGLGVSSIAIDPNNSQILYAALGSSYSDQSDIYKSTDRGDTWVDLNVSSTAGVVPRMDGNAELRGAGERLVVDPNNSDVIMFGSRKDGLFVSNDGGSNWSVNSNLPAGLDNFGITFAAFDQTSFSEELGSSSIIWAGVADDSVYGQNAIAGGVYRSTDGGLNFELQSGVGVDIPNMVDVSSDGDLIVSHITPWGWLTSGSVGGLWKYDKDSDVWSDISPELSTTQNGYGAVVFDPNNPENIIITNQEGINFYRSTNGGSNWDKIGFELESTGVPQWVPETAIYGDVFFHGGFDFDPQTGRLYYVNGWGVFSTTSVLDESTTWQYDMDGVEELVNNEVASLGNGRFVSAQWDTIGFTHSSATGFPLESVIQYGDGTSMFGRGTSVDAANSNSDYVYLVGYGNEANQDRSVGVRSFDGGASWEEFPQYPQDGNGVIMDGSISVSSNDPLNIVWSGLYNADFSSYQGNTFYSTDGGSTWSQSTGLPTLLINHWAPGQRQMISDPYQDGTFYMFNCSDHNAWQTSFYRSTDGGQTWSEVFAEYSDQIFCHTSTDLVPGTQAGEFYVVQKDSGTGEPLAFSLTQDGGESFDPIQGVATNTVFAMDLGAPQQGRSNLSMVVAAEIDGDYGIFVSPDATDLGLDLTNASWEKLSNDANAVPAISGIDAAIDQYGEVFVSTGGRGIMYNQYDDGQTPQNPGATSDPDYILPDQGAPALGSSVGFAALMFFFFIFFLG